MSGINIKFQWLTKPLISLNPELSVTLYQCIQNSLKLETINK